MFHKQGKQHADGQPSGYTSGHEQPGVLPPVSQCGGNAAGPRLAFEVTDIDVADRDKGRQRQKIAGILKRRNKTGGLLNL